MRRAEIGAAHDLSTVGRLFTEDHPDEGGFTGAVAPDHADFLGPPTGDGCALENRCNAVVFVDLRTLNQGFHDAFTVMCMCQRKVVYWFSLYREDCIPCNRTL